MENWAKVVDEPEFQSKRLNELWGLGKTRRMDKDMTPRQVLTVGELPNQALRVVHLRATSGKYRLAERFDISG
jgi:hypothetical protein